MASSTSRARVMQVGSLAPANRGERGFGVGARNDLDSIERYAGRLERCGAKSARCGPAAARSSARSSVPPDRGIPRTRGTRPPSGKPAADDSGPLVRDRSASRQRVDQRLVGVAGRGCEAASVSVENWNSRASVVLPLPGVPMIIGQPVVQSPLLRRLLEEGRKRLGRHDGQESLVVPQVFGRALFEGVRHARSLYACRWRRRKSGRMAGAVAPPRVRLRPVSAHSSATELLGVLCSSTSGRAQPPYPRPRCVTPPIPCVACAGIGIIVDSASAR